MKHQKPISPNYLLIILLVFSGINITAQDETPKKITIGDHIFTPITYSPLPSTNTYINTLAGFGRTINLFHSITLNEDLGVIGLSGEVTFVDVYFSYQQRIRDWLAAYIRLGMSARLGTEFQSILVQGFNTITNFKIGWQIKILEQDKFAFSATAELQNNAGSFINVLGFVNDIINDNPDPKIKESVPVLTVGSGLRFAYGFNDFIGISAITDFAYGETYIRGENGLSFTAGVGVDLDFYPKYSVPLGLIIHYNITSQPEFVYVDGSSAHIWKVKLAYTKSHDYSLGLEYALMKVPLRNVKNDPIVYLFALASRFYF
jgi:hypothetical protein